MDWSKDISEVQSSLTPHVSPAGENMLLPRALLHNRNARGKRRAEPIDSGPLLLNYDRKQPSIPSSWDGVHHALFIFRTDEMSEIDATNMAQCYGMLWTLTFFFFFYLFFLILYFFSFEFLFLFLFPFSDNKEVCDIAVT